MLQESSEAICLVFEKCLVAVTDFQEICKVVCSVLAKGLWHGHSYSGDLSQNSDKAVCSFFENGCYAAVMIFRKYIYHTTQNGNKTVITIFQKGH